MNLEKLVKTKTVEFNELVISRETLIELVRSKHIGVSDNVRVLLNATNDTITLQWERSTSDG